MVKEALFDLIKSMTMSEKRYFKIYSSKHTIGEKNEYIRLFDADEFTDFLYKLFSSLNYFIDDYVRTSLQ